MKFSFLCLFMVFFNLPSWALGYSMFKPTIKPGGWKLFDYMEDSLVASWENMEKVGLGTEIFFDGYSIYNSINSQSELKNGKN